MSEAAIHAAAGDEVGFVRLLFSEYAASLPVALAFQDFDAELADPLAVYECVLIAQEGCVALRRIDRATCEMKRLYVRPTARGSGLGRRLVAELIERAQAAGYERMLLDTLPTMNAARALYRSLGFRPTRPYRYNPIPGTSFLELELKARDGPIAKGDASGRR